MVAVIETTNRIESPCNVAEIGRLFSAIVRLCRGFLNSGGHTKLGV